MSVNFPKAEEDVLHHWQKIDAFETQLRLTKDGPRFSFYDGPPFGKRARESYTQMEISH